MPLPPIPKQVNTVKVQTINKATSMIASLSHFLFGKNRTNNTIIFHAKLKIYTELSISFDICSVFAFLGLEKIKHNLSS